MAEDKKENDSNSNEKANWSDFEFSLIELFNNNPNIDDKKLLEDFTKFQIEFSNFLNEIISPSMLATLGKKSTEQEIAIKSFSNFFQDLSQSDFNNVDI